MYRVLRIPAPSGRRDGRSDHPARPAVQARQGGGLARGGAAGRRGSATAV